MHGVGRAIAAAADARSVASALVCASSGSEPPWGYLGPVAVCHKISSRLVESIEGMYVPVCLPLT